MQYWLHVFVYALVLKAKCSLFMLNFIIMKMTKVATILVE